MDDADGFGIGLVVFVLIFIGFVTLIGLGLLIIVFVLKKHGFKIAGAIILGLILAIVLWAIYPVFY